MRLRAAGQVPAASLLGGLLLILGCASVSAAARERRGGAGGLRCELEAEPRHARGAPVRLRFALVNDGDQSLRVLRWYTPLEGLLGDLLEVRRDGGARLTYLGPKMKRGEPTAEEYVALGPGERVDAVVELGWGYDVSAGGDYAVRFAGRLADVAAAGDTVPRPRAAHRPVSLVGCGARFVVE